MAQKEIMPLCPFCGCSSEHYLTLKDYNRRVSSVPYHLAKCQSCTLLFISNPPEDLAPYYVTDYHIVPKTEADLEPCLPTEKFKIDLLTQFKKSGSLLEIGPGAGMFCQLSKRAGFDVSAIEMDENCVDFLKNVLDVKVKQSSDPTEVLKNETSKYDAICLWHSIEHIYNPWETLNAAYNRLSPDGVLLIAAPNPNAWQAKILGRYWPHHDIPRHLYGLSIPWIVEFARSKKLKVELVTTCDEGSLFWNRFSWAMLIQRMAASPLWRTRLWNLGMKIAKILQFWEGREGKGATYTIVLRHATDC